MKKNFRDLLKVCNRLGSVQNFGQHNQVLNLISDIYDCFLSFVSKKTMRIELITKIGCLFNINKEEVIKFLCINIFFLLLLYLFYKFKF